MSKIIFSSTVSNVFIYLMNGLAGSSVCAKMNYSIFEVYFKHIVPVRNLVDLDHQGFVSGSLRLSVTSLPPCHNFDCQINSIRNIWEESPGGITDIGLVCERAYGDCLK